MYGTRSATSPRYYPLLDATVGRPWWWLVEPPQGAASDMFDHFRLGREAVRVLEIDVVLRRGELRKNRA